MRDITISINGKATVYFSCCISVRQGDPLSPILLSMAEEDLSRGLEYLVIHKKLSLMSACRNTLVPSHCLYVDDVLILFMLPHNPCVLFHVTLMRFSVNRASVYIYICVCVCMCVRKYIWGVNTWKCYTLIVYVDILSLLTLQKYFTFKF